jgi:hypothetical protein
MSENVKAKDKTKVALLSGGIAGGIEAVSRNHMWPPGLPDFP